MRNSATVVSGALRPRLGTSSKQRLILGNIGLINHLVVSSRLSNCQLLSVQSHHEEVTIATNRAWRSVRLSYPTYSFTLLGYFSSVREGLEPTSPGLLTWRRGKSGRRTRSNRGLLFTLYSSRRRRLSQTDRLYVAIPYALMFWRWVSPALPTLCSSTGELSVPLLRRGITFWFLQKPHSRLQPRELAPFVYRRWLLVLRLLDFRTRAAHVTTEEQFI